MGDVDVDHEVSGPGARTRVRVRGSVRCNSRIGLWLHLGLGSDVRVTVRLNYSVTVRHG